MFYQGSLQEGISTAVGQQKLVLCFVTDENDESKKWEDDFLKDDSLSDLIKNQSVALRLKAGSEEAGYLSQIFPLPQTPTVVIIKNGELKEYITPGVTKEDFTRRVQTAFNAPAQNLQPRFAQSGQSPSQPQNTSGTQSATNPQEAERSDNVRRILAERAARLQAQKEEAERKAKEERAKAKEKAKAEADTGSDTHAARAHKQAELVKKKKKQEDEERRRILKRIEDDKAERRQRAAEREQKRMEGQSAGGGEGSETPPQTSIPSKTRISRMTALQVRLFDGSTIRSHFETQSSLSGVRKWVDGTRKDGSLPYTFKQVLTPIPNKNIDETEEDKTLEELGLAPSSTLVLIPVQSYSSAYNGASGNILTRFIRLLLGFLAWILGCIGIGGSGEPRGHEPTGAQAPTGTTSRNSPRVHGFQNPDDRRRDHQLYNGNSLNFEPRPEEDEK